METGAEPVEDPAAACSQAERWLDHGGLSAEAWRARLAELYATTTPAHDTAAAYLEAAVLLYNAAGDGQQAERVAGPGARLAPLRAKVSVDLKISQGEARSKPESWRIRLLPRSVRVPSDPLRLAIYEWTQAPAAEPYPPRLPDMMAGRWPELRSSLAELLAATELTKQLRRQAEPPDLSVRIYDGALQPLPWELAASKKHPDAPLFADFRRAYRERLATRRTRGWSGWSRPGSTYSARRFRSTGSAGRTRPRPSARTPKIQRRRTPGPTIPRRSSGCTRPDSRGHARA